MGLTKRSIALVNRNRNERGGRAREQEHFWIFSLTDLNPWDSQFWLLVIFSRSLITDQISMTINSDSLKMQQILKGWHPQSIMHILTKFGRTCNLWKLKLFGKIDKTYVRCTVYTLAYSCQHLFSKSILQFCSTEILIFSQKKKWLGFLFGSL